ncbi:nonhistone protein 6 [Cryptococcus deuterogattii R265]|uniref:nonhistone protein 6 n=1 Tax=Cryptococcus deuterogattii (strain R265) TaxID=294750 RepID=UPI0019366762|nr:nonhistone protein 6 [Cryptococcus deuterogattii R265]
MSAPSWEEMEAKRIEMIQSLREVSSAMTRCVQVIEEYTSLSPVHLSKPDLLQPLTAGGPLAVALASGLADAGVGSSGKKERKKKEKKIRDPNAPKRPPSAYILFQNEVRDDIRTSNPGMPYKDVLQIISQRWKELPDSEKKIFEDAYAAAHNNFRAEEEAYAKKDVVEVDPALMESSDDSSDDDSSEGESTPAAPMPAPTLAAAEKHKKDKKRKTKEEEAAVNAVLGEGKDKKKKKKSKD